MAISPKRLLIYEQDKTFIEKSTLKYPDIETGGDLFGLWQNESTVVVRVVTGPGRNCRRTKTAFFQDEQYLGNVGKHLTERNGLCNIGGWHSHHQINLPEPSYGDRNTVWSHMPSYGLKRFLLIIATIDSHRDKLFATFNGFIFTPPGHGRSSGNMYNVETQLLPGPSPYLGLESVVSICREGIERGHEQLIQEQSRMTRNDSEKRPRRRTLSFRRKKHAAEAYV